MSDFKVPKFATEAEEAKWWFENQDMLLEEFKMAAKAGTLGHGGARRLFAERGIPFPEEKTAPLPLPLPRFASTPWTSPKPVCRHPNAACATRLT
jgi:hypothetical protein